jgi:hypothetical protein
MAFAWELLLLLAMLKIKEVDNAEIFVTWPHYLIITFVIR